MKIMHWSCLLSLGAEQNGNRRIKGMTYLSLEHHLISLTVLYFGVKILRELQALVDVLLKPYCSLEEEHYAL